MSRSSRRAGSDFERERSRGCWRVSFPRPSRWRLRSPPACGPPPGNCSASSWSGLCRNRKRSMNERSDRRVATWLALLLFGVYLLSLSGMLYSQDSMSMFSVTESVVKRGQFDTDQMWTLFKARNEIARDGESYAKYGYGTSLAAVPLYALALALPGVGLVQTT